MAVAQRRRATSSPLLRAPSQVNAYLRYGIATLGGLGLLLGAIAVFSTSNGLGAGALLLVGTVLLVVALSNRVPAAPGWGRDTRAGREVEILHDLLGASDPRVRTFVAETVLQESLAPTWSLSEQDIRESAVRVLMERDLIRRLIDLLRGAGHVIESDVLPARPGPDVADVVIRLDGRDGKKAVPITVLNGPSATGADTIQRSAALASKLGAGSAVIVHTGPQPAGSPLPSTTAYGEVAVFSVFAPRLTDSGELLAAVASAIDAAAPKGRQRVLAAEQETGADQQAPRSAVEDMLPPASNGTAPEQERSPHFN